MDPLVVGWEETEGREWVVNYAAGVESVKLKERTNTKFGDSPQREYWRAKQNLDYSFLMWYASGLSDYYMQLEDDIQALFVQGPALP